MWVYPATSNVLKECGMHTIQHYINVLRQMIAKYVGLQHLCGMPGGSPNMLFGAQVLVVGAENVIERRLMQLDLAIKPFCSSFELFGYRGAPLLRHGRDNQIERYVIFCTCELIFWGGNTGG